MGAGIAASPHCAERRICRCSQPWSQTRRPRNPLSILAHQLRRRFPSDSSLLKRSPPSTRLRFPKVRWSFNLSGLLWTEVPSQNHPMFRGPSWVNPLRVPLCSPAEELRKPRRARGRSTLPAPLPDWPRNRPRRVFHIACRRRSVLLSPAAPSCRCRPSGEAGTSVPITYDHAPRFRVAQAKNLVLKPVDNGDIGNNSRNLS